MPFNNIEQVLCLVKKKMVKRNVTTDILCCIVAIFCTVTDA